MNGGRDEVSMGFENERPDSPGGWEGPYEYPPVESDIGYWTGRWVEFKRLFCLFWNDGYTKPAVLGSTAVVVVTLIGMQLFGWR